MRMGYFSRTSAYSSVSESVDDLAPTTGAIPLGDICCRQALPLFPKLHFHYSLIFVLFFSCAFDILIFRLDDFSHKCISLISTLFQFTYMDERYEKQQSTSLPVHITNNFHIHMYRSNRFPFLSFQV
jgi:hypothetical protein